MKTWGMAAWVLACAAGPLVFLRLVANGIALATRRLDYLTEQQRIAARRRAEQAETAKTRSSTQAA